MISAKSKALNKKITFKWGKIYEKVWEVIMEEFKNTT